MANLHITKCSSLLPSRAEYKIQLRMFILERSTSPNLKKHRVTPKITMDSRYNSLVNRHANSTPSPSQSLNSPTTKVTFTTTP